MTTITNHRTRLTLIDDVKYAEAREALTRLRQRNDFQGLLQLLEQELVIERTRYETLPASEFNRGQVDMLKKVLTLLGND